MKIVIETIPHSQQRYNTAGDYWVDADGTVQIRISAMKAPISEKLVAIHELVEFVLCEHHGITIEQIDAFDFANPQLDDPGANVRAPYHNEHTIAAAVEMLVCADTDLFWAQHDKIVSTPL